MCRESAAASAVTVWNLLFLFEQCRVLGRNSTTMKNNQALCQTTTTSWRRTLVTVMVCSVLAGCSSLSGPDRIEIPANTSDFRSRLYTGAAVGNSHLSPDTQGTVFTVESSDDMGTQLRLGYDVHNMLAVELDTSVLGTAQLREAGTDVKYSAASVSALVYGLSGVQLRSRREGLSAYGRVGVAALKKSSAVLPLEDSGTVPILGIGAEYGFSNGLGVRAELTRFDSDAAYAGFGAIYRFGLSPAGIGTMIAEAAEPALASRDTRVAEDGRTLTQASRSNRYGNTQQVSDQRDGRVGTGGSTAPSGPRASEYYSGSNPHASDNTRTVADRWRPAMRVNDRDGDGVLDNIDSCPESGARITVDQYGCGLFDAVLEDVTFKSGSRWLSPRARGQLDLLAETLLTFPESRVQVRAHTDSAGPADINLSLSSRRAEVVVKYLQSRGVHELQLQAVGIGEAQPLDANNDEAGRRRNRRIDIVTLPDQDAGQLLVASGVDSPKVITISDPGKRQPGRDDYSIAESEWNTAIPSPKRAKPTTTAPLEPGLLAAKPVKSDENRAAAANTAEKTTKTNKQSAPKKAAIMLIPESGYVPGLAISGIVEGLSFSRGSAELSTKAKQALIPLLEALRGNGEFGIAVMAHTDDKGDSDANKELSMKRAAAVVKYFANSGIDAQRMIAEGYGELLPLVQNLTEEDRARNRRVEIRILADGGR
jgi:OOP family OmpA-OmpF porin